VPLLILIPHLHGVFGCFCANFVSNVGVSQSFIPRKSTKNH